MLGETEAFWYNQLINEAAPPDMSANMHSISINADFDVYPNIAEPSEWWKLGNLKTDGVDRIIKAYRGEMTPAMRANRTNSISELALKYCNPNSRKLYHKSDLICRFMHEWGVDYMKISECCRKGLT